MESSRPRPGLWKGGEGKGVGQGQEGGGEGWGGSRRGPQGTCTSRSHPLSTLSPASLLCPSHSVLPMGPPFPTSPLPVQLVCGGHCSAL